ncbi:FAD binding domain-containing protein [Rhizohabitans arisaemae]|uniref:FAD binding domain-containing protein n=1 Tax=Rhizohabitans arisaemae TaxID=2720610 RepID=UPI0024B208B1|nr:xanthine dehydrogenase family protein subunit M [Rhizohabitans arisaemae]
MIPATFDYVRPSTLGEAAAALAEAGEDAKVLAGGQSLLPLLRLRLAYPSVLVDLGRVAELRGIEDRGDRLHIGAMTTHDEVVNSPLVNEHCPLLARATATVADPAIRHRGTFGGSLSHADPAGDLPSVALALDAEFRLASAAGERTVPAADFFADYLTTALEPDEILTGVSVPKLGPDWGCHYEKFHRTAQAWAIVGVAAAVRHSGGAVVEARIALTNMGATPVRAHAVESALAGVPLNGSGAGVREAALRADEGTNPPSDADAGADYRRHLAKVLTRRAVIAATSG